MARGSGDQQKGDRTLELQLAHPQQQPQFDFVAEEMTVGQIAIFIHGDWNEHERTS